MSPDESSDSIRASSSALAFASGEWSLQRLTTNASLQPVFTPSSGLPRCVLASGIPARLSLSNAQRTSGGMINQGLPSVVSNGRHAESKDQCIAEWRRWSTVRVGNDFFAGRIPSVSNGVSAPHSAVRRATMIDG